MQSRLRGYAEQAVLVDPTLLIKIPPPDNVQSPG